MANQIKKKYLAQEVIDYFDNQINAVESDVSGIDGRLTTAEGEINTLQSDVSAIDGRLTTAEGEINTLQSDVSAIDGRLTTAEGEINTLQSDVSAIDGRVTTAEGEIDTLQSDVIALDGRLDTAESDINAIEATLPLKADLVGGLVPANQLPSYVDDVLEFNDLASFPATGESGKIYVAKDTNKTYRWSGSAYIYITSGAVDSVFGRTGVVTAQSGDYNSDQVTEGSTNLYYTAARQAAIEAYADQAEADAKSYADSLDAAMDSRVDVLEGRTFEKHKVVFSGQSFIDLPHLAVANSINASVDRLVIHEGASEDFSVSVVGGVTRITFLNDLVSPGNQQLQNGDNLYFNYYK